MIRTKADNELEYMREAGKIVALAHQAVKDAIKAGISTKQINEIVENVIMEHDAYPSFKNLYGFPAATCVSVNNVLVHGIPDDTVLQDGDIVSVDIGACYQGYHGDSAWTYAVGNISEETKAFLRISEESLYEGLKMAKAGNHLTDISHAIGEYVFGHGFSLPRDYAGHGIGTSVHEDPTVPNFGPAGHGILLKEGMTLAIEPLVLAGRPHTRTLADGWGVVTKDGGLAAHYEHTIVITEKGYEILTEIKEEEHPSNG